MDRLQTSGTSNFGDHPISGAPDLTIHSDEDDIYGWEKQTADAWILRKIDVAITDLGEQLDVKTAVINPPLICKFRYLGLGFRNSNLTLRDCRRYRCRPYQPTLAASPCLDQNRTA
jgi:hypothetical protein